MPEICIWFGFLACYACSVLTCSQVVQAESKPPSIRVGGGVLRSQAMSSTLPDYPAESIRAKVQGPAVAEVAVDTDGSVISVDVLDAPDAFTQRSVSAALVLWRFRPMTYSGRPARASGRLVFYFKITRGTPVVVDATSERLRAGRRK